MKPPPASLVLSALTFSGLCRAATDAPAIPDPIAGFGQMLFGLALVLGILAVSVWLLKRFSSPIRGSGFLRVLGVTAVGPREKVVLLEVGEKVLMLGVTSNNVRTLHVFERSELPLVPAPAASPATTLAASFANRLAQALKGRRNEG